MKRAMLLAVTAIMFLTGPAMAGDILWYLGHSGYDEGHNDISAFLGPMSAGFDVVSTNPLPALGGYSLVFIVMPGFSNANDFFDADEKARLNTWLAIGSHRVVMVGDWDGFYQGQAVMNDLLAAIGNPIVFDPGAYDYYCGHCNGPMGDPDPLTDGLSHICYGLTPTWDPAYGVPLAYPEDPTAPGPWVVSNGTDIPCIVGIGDQNAITDPCGYLSAAEGDADTKEFVRRLYTITCAGEQLWACCFCDGTCQASTLEDCERLGGQYYEGLTCDEIECPIGPSAVDRATWGTVKTLHR